MKTKTYKEVIEEGLILPKKSKYTLRDYKKLRKDYSVNLASFIVKCSAIYWNTEWSKMFNKSCDDLAILEMVGQI